VVCKRHQRGRKKMRFFWAIFLIVGALAWTLFWLCTSVTVYDSDLSELKTFEITCFLLMTLGLAPLVFGIRLLEPKTDW
jgi:protein-S-isoprenylcysteine O-methyltransferase Ste14